MKKLVVILCTAFLLEIIFFSPMICKVVFGFGWMYTKFMTFSAIAFSFFGTAMLTEYYYDEERQIESDKRFIIRELKRLSKKYPELVYSYYIDRWDMNIIMFKDPLLCDGLMGTLQDKLNKKLHGEAVVIEAYPEFNKIYHLLIYES